MANRKTVPRGDDPLVLPVAQLKRQRLLANLDVLKASCCSSNGSPVQESMDLVHIIYEHSVKENETITLDLEDRYRRETTNSSQSSTGEMTKPPENETPPEKKPPADEIEKFFAAAEKQQQKYYTEKYNYDFVKDVPLKGRYEWVQIKP